MPGFDAAWMVVAREREGEGVSPGLNPLLHEVYSQILANPKNLPALKKSLEELLKFLAGEGRTNANCWAVDLFFCLSEGWEADWGEQELPEEFHDVLVMMGAALHDTVRARDIAENFDCLPEQLLTRVMRIQIGTKKE
jgi:hypothetical protein